MSWYKLFRNNSGLSLTEMLIAIGLIGITSLAVVQLTASIQSGKVTSETKVEELELKRIITTTLSDRLACFNTLNGVSVGSSFTQIKSAVGTVIFQTDRAYGNNAIKINSMRIVDNDLSFEDGTRSVNLVVGLEKMKKLALGKEKIDFDIELRVVSTGSSTPITDCFVNNDSIVQKSCESLKGLWIDGKCELPKCAEGQIFEAINTDGEAVCRTMGCSTGYGFRALDSSGNSVCERLNVYNN